MQVAGKTVLLTGGSAGIGRELALQLKGKGAKLVLTGRNPERLDTMSGEGFETIAADLSSAAGVDALVELVVFVVELREQARFERGQSRRLHRAERRQRQVQPAPPAPPSSTPRLGRRIRPRAVRRSR